MTENKLSNPHTLKSQYQTTYDKEKGLITTSWFQLTKDSFKVTANYTSPYTAGMDYSYTEIAFDKILPKKLKFEYLNGNEFTINGHRAHTDLEINPETGKSNTLKLLHTHTLKKKNQQPLQYYVNTLQHTRKKQGLSLDY